MDWQNVIRKMFLALAFFVLSLSCSMLRDVTDEQLASLERFSPEYWPTTAWRVHNPKEEGIDSEKLLEFFDIVLEKEIDLHSILVIRDGYIVMEAYYYPFQKDVKHQLFSATKSITGILMGMAIEDGYINGVETPVLTFFGHQSIQNRNEWKEEITLEHLLGMASGLQWNETDYSSPTNAIYEMRAQSDWAKYVLDQPMATKPGTEFVYNSGNSVVLMKILEREVGEHSVGYADRRLFSPLGITDYYWMTDQNMTASGDTGLMMSPRDIAKIGMLFLYGGAWEDDQLLSEEWVQESTKTHFSFKKLAPAYGYHWWLMRDGYYATGYAGQNIFVIPKFELVVVTTAGEPEGISWDLLTKGILPAVVSDEQLEQNQTGILALRAKEKQVGSQPEPMPVVALPATADQITGQYFAANPNQIGIERFKLTFNQDSMSVWLDYGNQEVTWRAAMDNVYRYTDVYKFGQNPVPMAAKARWTSDTRLIIQAQPLIGASEDVIKLNFQGSGESVTVEWQWGQFWVEFDAHRMKENQ